MSNTQASYIAQIKQIIFLSKNSTKRNMCTSCCNNVYFLTKTHGVFIVNAKIK